MSQAKICSKVPYLLLNNGLQMPMLGLGTSLKRRGPKTALAQELIDAVELAIDIGYRSFDTAWSYNIEQEIGQAVRRKIAEGKVEREDLFITTKLPNIFHKPERVVEGLKKALDKLQLDYIDLYLIHTPMGSRYIDDDTCFPDGPDGKPLLEPYDHVSIWKEMERAVDLGLTRSIGLSNFNHKQVQRILHNARIKPANLQVECHAYFMQHRLFDFCKKNGITMTCYAPLGSPAVRNIISNMTPKPALFEDPLVVKIAQRHHKTVAQVLLRHLIERGRAVIPKSTSPARLRENFDIFDFTLTVEELEELDGLDRNLRYFDEVFVRYKNSPDYPFDEPF